MPSRRQAITWANVDPDLCPHMVSLGLSELIWQMYQVFYVFLFWINFVLSLSTMLLLINRWGQVVHIYINQLSLGHWLYQMMACWLFIEYTVPSHHLILNPWWLIVYCLLDVMNKMYPNLNQSMNFSLKGQCIWKCCLQYGIHFVQASLC